MDKISLEEAILLKSLNLFSDQGRFVKLQLKNHITVEGVISIKGSSCHKFGYDGADYGNFYTEFQLNNESIINSVKYDDIIKYSLT